MVCMVICLKVGMVTLNFLDIKTKKTMNDLSYILKLSKEKYFSVWSREDIEDCKHKILNLSEEEIRILFRSRWMSKLNPLYNPLFEIVYKEQLVGKCKEIEDASLKDLLHLAKKKRDTYERYKAIEVLYYRYEKLPIEDQMKVQDLLIMTGHIKSKIESNTASEIQSKETEDSRIL